MIVKKFYLKCHVWISDMKMSGINDYMYTCKLKCTVKHSVKLWMHWFDSHFTAVKVPVHYSSVRVYQTSMSPVK